VYAWVGLPVLEVNPSPKSHVKSAIVPEIIELVLVNTATESSQELATVKFAIGFG
jgi:hypothetical protein